MKKERVGEDVMQMRKLFRLKFEGELTQEELEGRVNEIIGRQITLLPSVGEKVSGFRCQVPGIRYQSSDLKPKTWNPEPEKNLKPKREAVK